MAAGENAIIPAAGRVVPVGAYDTIVAWTMREQLWRTRIVDDIAARLGEAPAIADVGAGTGSLACLLRQRIPAARITAVEPDERTRGIGQAKLASLDPGHAAPDPGRTAPDHVTLPIAWVDAHAEALPLAGDSQDAVVMALMLHHLAPAEKRRALGEARRILKPGGSLYVADFGRPHDPLMAAAFAVIQLVDGVTSTRQHRAGELPKMIVDGGFTATTDLLRLRTLFGSFELLRARLGGPFSSRS
jgi:ubiquinone/menaquinone biosynthesis C-methylase UbiE